ncbi:MAG: hypothetical protein SWK76_07115 [Actinomycetota bacterium]|nr:hypothetical protein [Actinomycetota bacterium]
MGTSLWEVIDITGLRLDNRTVMPAMGTGYASNKGEVSKRLPAYLRERAGGAGTIITEVCAVHPLGKGLRSELGLYDDSLLPGLRSLTETVKVGGSRVAAQLHHTGREAFRQVIGEQSMAPSSIPSRDIGQLPCTLTMEEIAELVGCYNPGG